MENATGKNEDRIEPNEKLCLSSTVDLSHPEILPTSTLRGLLLEMNLVNGNVVALDKPALVKLFHETILPRPQRKYRANRRGLQLSESQLSSQDSAATNEKQGSQSLKRPLSHEPPKISAKKNNIIGIIKPTSNLLSGEDREENNTQGMSGKSEPVIPPGKKHARITWP